MRSAIVHADLVTVPADSAADSPVRIRAASPLVLVAMGLGVAPADAIRFAQARAAESARLAVFSANDAKRRDFVRRESCRGMNPAKQHLT